MQTDNKQTNTNEYTEQELSDLSNVSSYFGLAGVLISIYNNRANPPNNPGQGSPIPEEDLRLTAIILVGIGIAIEYFVSSETLKNVLKENGKRHPYHTAAAKNQLAARVFSGIAVVLLIIAEFQNRLAEEGPPIAPIPTLSGIV